LDIGILGRSFFGDEEKGLFWIWRNDSFTYEEVGQRLVVVNKSTVITEEQVVIELFRRDGRVFDFGQDVLREWLLL
jgi:hypothetical protein